MAHQPEQKKQKKQQNPNAAALQGNQPDECSELSEEELDTAVGGASDLNQSGGPSDLNQSGGGRRAFGFGGHGGAAGGGAG